MKIKQLQQALLKSYSKDLCYDKARYEERKMMIK